MKTKILIIAIVCMSFCSTMFAQSVTTKIETTLQKKECIINDTKTQEPKIKKVFMSDNTGKRVEMIVYLWDKKAKDWQLSEKTEYKYDKNNELAQMVRMEWDRADSSWRNRKVQEMNRS